MPKTIFPWFGGKAYSAKRIAKIVDACPHTVYVEPFGGAASVLFAKRPVKLDVYNDLHSGLVTFFRVLRDPVQCEALASALELTPYARDEMTDCFDTWEACGEPVERARRFFVAVAQNFCGAAGLGNCGHRRAFAMQTSDAAGVVNSRGWVRRPDALRAYGREMVKRGVQVDSDPWEKILPRYDGTRTLFYCDPPYVTNTRRSGSYTHEMTDADHALLVDALLCLQGQAILSGYDTTIYAPLVEAGWLVQRLDQPCHSAARTKSTRLLGKGATVANQRRTECLWISPGVRKHGLDFGG